jgi:hypothetical protein
MAMLAWMLILSSWVALLSLILHDATKDDSDGSAIALAARKIKAFAFWAKLKARRLRGTLSYRTSPRSVSKHPAKVVTALNGISSPSTEIKQGGPSVNKRARTLPPKKNWWRKDSRVPMTTPELELAISEAMKKAAPGCEDFGGVIVQRKTPKSHIDPNWAIRGAKFGKADRKVAHEALATIVERMQREFLLSED